MAGTLKQSPLHDRHEALGAKFAEFGGWSMPLEYPTGVVKEHTAVREAVGIFDVSHLGKAMVSGPGARAFVHSTLSNDLGKIEPGKAQYTLCCVPETGGIVDDLIAYLHDDERLLLMPNAANTAEVVSMLRTDAPEGVVVEEDARERGRCLGVVPVECGGPQLLGGGGEQLVQPAALDVEPELELEGTGEAESRAERSLVEPCGGGEVVLFDGGEERVAVAPDVAAEGHRTGGVVRILHQQRVEFVDRLAQGGAAAFRREVGPEEIDQPIARRGAAW